jgi:transmembrane sensor
MSETAMGDVTMRARRDEIDAEARQWMSYLYSGETTEQGEAEFRAWLSQNPDHRAAFHMLNDIWTSLDRVRDIESGLVAAPPDSSKGIQPWKRRLARLAANVALAAAIAALAILATLHLMNPLDERRLASEIGEIRALGLIDGTRLVLRADTAVVASMSREGRSVVIERGGAYFDVSRDENLPFVVSAGDVDIRVHGTAFDVLKGPSSVTLSVTHGRVTVSKVTNQSRSGARSVELTGGQQLTVAADGTFGAMVTFEPKNVLGWRDGRFSYSNARLEDIVADVNRYRSVKIEIEDQTLKDLRITTMFRIENADQMLAGIAATEPVTIVRSPSSISIRRREGP